MVGVTFAENFFCGLYLSCTALCHFFFTCVFLFLLVVTVTPIMSLYTDSGSAQIGITTMFAILVTANLVGNMIVCLVIIIYQDMRYSSCYCLFKSLFLRFG